VSVQVDWVRGACCALSTVVALAMPLAARAAELRVSAPEPCAEAAAIRAQVESLIGRPLAEVERVDFDVAITARPGGDFMLTLRISEREAGAEAGTRELLGASCAEVSDAAAVAIALAITGDEAPLAQRLAAEHARATAAATAAPPELPPPAPAPVVTAAPAPARAAEPSPRWFAVALGGVLDGGTLPALAPGAQLELVAGLGAFSLRVYGGALAPQEASLPGSDAGAELGLLLGGGLLCGERAFTALRMLACAGAELGALSGQGKMIAEPEERSVLFGALRADVGAGIELQPSLWLIARGGVAVPLARREFQINRGMTVHRPASVAGRALLGLELRL
jgi:hypothetical protein